MGQAVSGYWNKKSEQFGLWFDSSPDGESMIQAAAEGDEPRVVEFLMDVGVKVDYLSPKTKETALFGAVRNGHIKLAKLLWRQGADVNIANKTGQTPVHVAIQEGHFDIVRWIVADGEAKLTLKDADGKEPEDYLPEDGDELGMRKFFSEERAKAEAQRKYMEEALEGTEGI